MDHREGQAVAGSSRGALPVTRSVAKNNGVTVLAFGWMIFFRARRDDVHNTGRCMTMWQKRSSGLCAAR